LPSGAGLFVEDRQDLAAELLSRGRRHSVDHSRTCGMAYQSPAADLRFVADARPDDLEGWLREERPGERRRGAAESEHADPRLSASEALEDLSRLVSATEKLHKNAQISARWVGFDQRVHLARPGCEIAHDVRRSRRVRLQVVLTRRGRAACAVGEAVLRSDSDENLDKQLDLLAGEVAARVEIRLTAEAPIPGERRVVFAPGVGGVLFHEIVGHALEADTIVGGASWLSGGSTEAFRGSPHVTVVDDPRRGRAAWRLDDEGQPARAVPLFREGRVCGWLHDRASARRSGTQPTGHGRRASFRDPVRPRMGCTFLTAGRCDPSEALGGIEEGIYVRRMEAASTDTRTGHAEFRVTDADRIRHGRLAAPLTPHVMEVSAQAALSSVDRVANDLAFDTCVGSCLHHGQPLSVTVGAPTFRIGLVRVVG